MDQKIYQTIRNRILFMDYAPGEIINENSLAEEFGVSRTPIRQIFNRLEWENLVRIIPRKGTMIAEVEFRKLTEVFRIRMEIERLIGLLAAERITKRHLESLDELVVRCQDMREHEDCQRLISVELDCRNVLHDAANNKILAKISNYLWSLTIRVWISILDRNNWAFEVDDMIKEITLTRQALTEKTPQEVGELRQQFLTKFLERIKDRF
ncbi:MAG: GntR family transcriptional regulator [Desulfarculaceae bacterium]|jgi:DNA-binding GntR family transcriptional regulator